MIFFFLLRSSSTCLTLYRRSAGRFI